MILISGLCSPSFKSTLSFSCTYLFQKFVKCRPADVQPGCHLGLCAPAAEVVLVCFIPLILRNGNLFTTLVDTLLLGFCYTLSLSFQKICSLEFIDSSNHGQHQLSGWSGCVQILFIAYQMNLLLIQLINYLQQVLRLSGQPG